MSTRATYLFKGRDEWSPDVCLYIHHDGYQSGAAYYLYNAFNVGDGSVNAESMIRGNHRADLTRSHDAHGDTEYRYTIDGEMLLAESRHTLIEFGSYPDGWHTVFNGDWVDFVNDHLDAEWVDGDVQPIKRVDIGYCKGSPYTPKMVHKELSAELALLGQWTVGAYADSPDAANMRGLKDKIKKLQALIGGFGTPQWKEAAA